MNAIKDSVTDVIADAEFCSEDGVNKLVHGAIDHAASQVSEKIKDMEIKGIFHVIGCDFFYVTNFFYEKLKC